MKNLPASVRARLLNQARQRGIPFNEILVRFGIERLLYRLQMSVHAEDFILKGAMLFLNWEDELHRPTRDADFLTSGSPEVDRLGDVFREVIETQVEPDGVEFDVDSLRAEPIREDSLYHGVRIRFEASLDGAKIPLQVDVGFGDSVVPGPTTVGIPGLLEFPSPILKGYTRYTAVAEKFEAMVKLGEANSRMKDFYDIWTLSRSFEFDGAQLADSIRATFARRSVELPEARPLALTSRFAELPGKTQQWKAFVRKVRRDEHRPELQLVIRRIDGLLWPAAVAARVEGSFRNRWSPADQSWITLRN